MENIIKKKTALILPPLAKKTKDRDKTELKVESKNESAIINNNDEGKKLELFIGRNSSKLISSGYDEAELKSFIKKLITHDFILKIITRIVTLLLGSVMLLKSQDIEIFKEILDFFK